MLAVKNLSLDVHKGEIVGIAGVDGNGQTELVEALSGLRPTSKGEVIFDGKNIESISPRKRRRAGLAHVPEDRANTGLNLKIRYLGKLSRNLIFQKPSF